jgi:sugar phosphate isomerase/epimerase
MNRREFLGLSAAALLGAKGALGKSTGMYPALNSVLISGRAKWPEFAELAARVGYPGVDVALERAMPEGAEATRALLGRLKLKPAAVSFPVDFRKDDTVFQAGLKKLGAAAEFAAAIGCPRMATWVIASGPLPKDEQRKIYKERFSAAARVLAGSGVRLGLEFVGPLALRRQGPHEFIWRMSEMAEFAAECGPNVGLLLDAWHWHHAGATTQDIITAGKQRIVHVHISDSAKLPPEQVKDNERLLPGEGVIDLAGFLRALAKIGYSDALSIEVFGRTKDMPVEEAAAAGLKSTLEVMKKAGVA